MGSSKPGPEAQRGGFVGWRGASDEPEAWANRCLRRSGRIFPGESWRRDDHKDIPAGAEGRLLDAHMDLMSPICPRLA